MNAKRAGILFCAIVLVSTVIELLLTFTPLAEYMGLLGTLAASELIMIVPCLIAFALCKEPFGQTFGVRKVHPALVPLCILFTWSLLPVVTCCNAFTMYFTENETTAIFQSLSDLPLPVIALFTAVIAPVCEECTFRGILYTGFRKNGSAVQAILLTAVLFGAFHMNLNQMVYAMVLGVVFAVLREVTGSIVPSIVCHITVNGGSTFLLLLESDKLTETLEESAGGMSAESLSVILAMLIPVAAVMGAMALALLIKIAKTQKALPRLLDIPAGRVRERGKVMGTPVILGLAICLAFVCIELFMSQIIEFLQGSGVQ